jgi:hypothetical protein
VRLIKLKSLLIYALMTLGVVGASIFLIYLFISESAIEIWAFAIFFVFIFSALIYELKIQSKAPRNTNFIKITIFSNFVKAALYFVGLSLFLLFIIIIISDVFM